MVIEQLVNATGLRNLHNEKLTHHTVVRAQYSHNSEIFYVCRTLHIIKL